MRNFVKVATLIAVTYCGASAITVQAQGSAVLTTSPACPTYTTDPATHRTAIESITVQYDGNAKEALRSARSLTLHVALPQMSRMGTVQDFPMTRRQDGMWLANVTLTGDGLRDSYL